ncbi:hypothetical protein GTA08_BOTSDO06090 [Neofusicoccum parvum]|uniref:Uncharacterized protein n=1 Tax=Neofusicoccum parvum TaxID=310453 RepID=A0ACB5SHA5_9PEZI|nr:hypothetical protein GTA08_BOTSDO06090 [Neofusicoccum parvum]
MFALYLDIQKQLVLEDLDGDEAKGRWKSFVGKWNRGELAEGWYDPATLERAVAAAAENGAPAGEAEGRGRRRSSPDYGGAARRGAEEKADADGSEDEDDDDDDDEFGPAALPGDAVGFVAAASSSRKSGPAIPRLEDLDMRNELNADDAADRLAHMRALRKADRALQKERLEEMAPRADPGSRERQLEKRRETTDAMRAFRDAKAPGEMEEIGERDLMGGGDGVDEFRARKREEERKKSERDIRKEEVLRARAAEREEKFAEHRAKEEKTMEMLRALARQRFGGGGGGGSGSGGE